MGRSAESRILVAVERGEISPHDLILLLKGFDILPVDGGNWKRTLNVALNSLGKREVANLFRMIVEGRGENTHASGKREGGLKVGRSGVKRNSRTTEKTIRSAKWERRNRDSRN